MSGTTLPVALTGNGQAPANIIVEGTNPFNYGLVVNGNDVVNTFTIRNDGDVEATDLAGAIALTGDYSFVGGAFPGGTAPTACVAAGTLAPAATCTIEVQFSPTTPGLQTNNLQVIYDNGVSAGNIADVQLDGTGVTPALLVIAGTGAHNFGTAAQGGFVENTFFVTNNGSAIATGLTEIGLTGNFENVGGAFPGGGTCGTSLANGATCSFVARFTPGATGLLTDDIELTYNDGTGPATATRAVEGTGITPALLSMNQTDPYNFGVVAVGGVGEVTIEITNGGDSIALGMGGTLTPPYAFKDGAYPGTGGDCAFSLPGGGATCEIVVTFSPTTVEPCLLYTSPSPRDATLSRMPSSA